ncbi:MAG: aminotransferase class V-fold PLP-dependent enzyme [Acidimicrobiia bacterium]|nr:aminotransferase class V-fold PLP-dependent enzyme [Acidimicrobiia bacterium]
MGRIGAHEATLSARFLDGVSRIDGVTVRGVAGAEGRTPTFALEVAGRSTRAVAEELGRAGIFVWDGHYYALEVMRRLGVPDGGLVRIGFVHYNTLDEVDRVLTALDAL